ncbi:MAG TPA: hypothetical protein VEO54_15485 [Thermoanaerobaculia bacterium]|nr:hypothetical protein [Thermoanaerobaculia bacterium]
MTSVLNIAGPEYDFGSVVFVVLEELEHRRRSLERDELEYRLKETAKAKLKQIKRAFDEFGGSASYWATLEKEVLETALPQYVDAAEEMNELERSGYGVWRKGDPAARFAFAVGGLFIGSIIIILPFIPVAEVFVTMGLTAAGAAYPEIKRYTHERRHFQTLNRLVNDAAAYQANARLHYMTTTDIKESFTLNAPALPSEREEPPLSS